MSAVVEYGRDEFETIQIKKKTPEELAQLLTDAFYRADHLKFSVNGERPLWENMKPHDKANVFQAASTFFASILDMEEPPVVEYP